MIGLDQILSNSSYLITIGCKIAWQHIGYVIDYKKNIQNLLDETEKFENELTRIDGRVERAINNGEIPEADVLQWIESANGIKGDVEALLVDATRENMWCLKCCPNVSRRYKLGKESKEKTTRVIILKDSGKQYMTIDVAHRPPPLKFGYNFSQGYVAFDSRAEIFEEIMKALADPCIKMIGLYGPGGVGKTTMATEVGKLAKQNGLFDDVVMATISQTLNAKAVKEKLALQLDLTLDGNAYQLYHRLNNGKRNLVILDDVWKPLNLVDIEIPITDGNKGCKVVITSRKRGLCQKMSVPVDQEDSLNAVLAEPEAWTREFLMGVLREPEAWTLFKKVAAISVDSQIPFEANEVCEKCGGLPVAIRAVAAALKGKGEKHFWQDALQQLENYQIKEIADIDQNLLISLNWSYDHLEHTDAKSCFLLCSLFPEDAAISIDDLVRYSIGMRLLNQNQNIFDRVRVRVLAMVHVLKTSCLLLDDDKDKSVVKMHDIIRDVAISIAEDKKAYMVKHGIETWPEKYELYLAISLRFITNIHKLPNELKCKRLHTLVLKCSNDSPTDFPNNFFNGMENNLEVLDLSEMPIKSLPSSLSTLVKLRMLCLNGGRLMTEIALLGILGSLRNLEILSLTGMEKVLFHGEDGMGFSELQFLKSQPQIPPGSFCNLCELRVENCQFKFLFTHSIARGLEQLQRLEIGDCEDMEEIIRNERQGDEEEIIFHHLKKMVLKDLPNLRSFYSSMKNTSTTEANNSNPSRPLFCEKVAFPALEELETSAVGKISGIIGGKQLVEQEENESFWQLRKLPRLRNLYISECSKLKAIGVADKEGGAHNKPLVFPELPSLRVFGIDNLKSVYDNCGPEGEEEKEILEPQPLFNEKVLFSSLEELQLKDLPALTHLWKGPTKLVRLCNLTSLKLNRCDKLESMFSLCIARDLMQLQILSIFECRKMEILISSEEEGDQNEIASTTTDKIVFPKLKELCLGGLPSFTAISKVMNGIELLQLNKLILWEMPKLNSLCNTSDSNCDTIQPLFNKVLFSSLEELQLKDLPALTNLWKGSTKLARLCNLTSLKLNRCDKLESMFPLCIARDLMQLQILSVFECRKMEVLISSEEEGDQNEIASTTTDKIVFSKLKELCLGGMPSFTSISKDINGIELLQLNKLILWEMPKLNSLCNTSDSNYDTIQPLFNKVIFSALEELRIDRLPKITELWYRKLLPSESFRQLRYMTIRNCQELKVIVLENGEEEVKVENNNNIISFPQLTSLTLEHLQSLESFCTSRSETQSLFTSQVAFPALEELLISGVPNITEIWGKQFPSELKVNCFEKLMNAVQSNMLPRLQNPRKLSENAKKKAMAQENKRNDDVIIFPRLRTVRLDNLQNLEFFCRTRRFETQTLFNHQIACPELRVLAISWVPNITDVWDKKLLPTGSFCQLREVRIEGCDKLVNVILSNMLPRLQNLTELSVQYCPMVEEILSEKGEEKEDAEANENVILFPQLETLELGSLENLKSFCTSKLAAQHFFKHPGAFASLKELHICNLPNITEIWGKQLLPVPKTDAESFEKLAVVNATWCDKLVNVIPSSMFPRLENLKSIYVKGCPEMEVIVSKKANTTVNGDIIYFPQLRSLSIDKLYNLKSFCSSSTSAEAQPLFNDQVVFPVLEDLFIDSVRNITKIWDKLHSRESFCFLKRMMIEDCEKMVNVVPSYMLPQLRNLEVLNAYSCLKMLAIVSEEKGKEKDVDENTILFPKLTTLNLKSLDNFKTFYTQAFLNYQVALPKLKNLCLDQYLQQRLLKGKECAIMNENDDKEIEQDKQRLLKGKEFEIMNENDDKETEQDKRRRLKGKEFRSYE